MGGKPLRFFFLVKARITKRVQMRISRKRIARCGNDVDDGRKKDTDFAMLSIFCIHSFIEQSKGPGWVAAAGGLASATLV